MDEILKNIILISAMGSVLALILLCIKPLTKRLFSFIILVKRIL